MCSRKKVFVKDSMTKRKKMSFLFILVPWLSNELLWSINKLKQDYGALFDYHIYIYIYIYREREREREKDIDTKIQVNIHVYIHNIYIHIYICIYIYISIKIVDLYRYIQDVGETIWRLASFLLGISQPMSLICINLCALILHDNKKWI